jgi:hypothetical protein
MPLIFLFKNNFAPGADDCQRRNLIIHPQRQFVKRNFAQKIKKFLSHFCAFCQLTSGVNSQFVQKNTFSLCNLPLVIMIEM